MSEDRPLYKPLADPVPGATVVHFVPNMLPPAVKTDIRARIVSWTTPHMRAEKAWAEAGVLLEFGRDKEARAAIARHLAEVRDLMAWLEASGR